MKIKKEMNKLVLPHLNHKVVKEIRGFQLCAYLVAYEGWRRGLTLKWYQDESSKCKLDRMNSSTSGKFFSLSDGENIHYFFRSRGDRVANKTVSLCQNKEKTKAYLKKEKVPTPEGGEFSVTSKNEMIKYAESIGYPVVLKPVGGSMGKGVFTNVMNSKELVEIINHFSTAYKYDKCLLEKHYAGNEYRIYVVNNEAVSVVNRIPANVIGDGKMTISQLIRAKNKDRKSNPYLAIKPIKIDYEINRMLKKQNLNEESVPLKGEQIFLREMSNLSAGGDPLESSHKISDEIKQIAVDALKAMPSIAHGGVDVIVDQHDSKKGVVLEINATAEIGFHSFPLAGQPKDVPSAIIDYYFPNTKNAEKSHFYFDYKSILEPLKLWSAESVEISQAPVGKVYGMKYIVSGKVIKVGYMNWIRRQALSKSIHGNAKRTKDNAIQVIVYSTDKERIQKFKEKCMQGSKKSEITAVESSEMDMIKEQFVQTGFQIL